MIKTIYYRYECSLCGYIVCRSYDAGDLKCPACKTEKEYVEGEGNFTIKRLEETIEKLGNEIQELRRAIG